MTKIEKGQELVLKNIFFDSGESTLKQESKAELNVLAKYLEINEGLYLENMSINDKLEQHDKHEHSFLLDKVVPSHGSQP